MNCAAEDIDLRAELGLRIHRLYSDDPNGPAPEPAAKQTERAQRTAVSKLMTAMTNVKCYNGYHGSS
jgi:hypothetical protein